jgi:hypothetical protein
VPSRPSLFPFTIRYSPTARGCVFAFLVASVLTPAPLLASVLRGAGSWGWDSNVLEEMDAKRRVQDSFLRLLVEAAPEPFRLGRQSLGLRARGLTERYFHYASDSRYQAEGSLLATRQTGRAASLWLSGRGEFRSYPDNTDRNYQRGNATLGVAAKARGGDFNFAWALRGLDYRRTPRFDRKAQAVTLDYRRAVRRRFEFSGTAEFEWSRYGRDAVRWPPEETDVTSRQQRDRGREARLAVQYMRGWLFETFVAWEQVRSNSYGYSLGRRSLGGMASGWLPGDLLLQVRGRVESTSYRDSGLADVYVLRAGENQEAGEDNNSLQVRLRRPVGPAWSLEGRISWFRNESLLVGSYYRKTVCGLGIAWTPVGTSDF